MKLGALPDFEFISTMPAVTCIHRLVLRPWTCLGGRVPRGKGARGQGAMRADAIGQGQQGTVKGPRTRDQGQGCKGAKGQEQGC